MSFQITAERTETELPINLTVTDASGPVSGATAVVAIRDGDTNDSWLDFNDSTFKTAGWTTRQAALTASGTQAGLYTLNGGLNLTTITNLPVATLHLLAEYEVTAPTASKGLVMDFIFLSPAPAAAPTAAAIADAVWDEVRTGHTTANTFGLFVDAQISLIGTTAAIADAVWDEVRTGHTTANTFGFFLDAAISSVGGLSAAAIADAVWDEVRTGHTTANTFGLFLDAQVSTAPPTVAAIADASWDEPRAGHVTAGSFGESMGNVLRINGSTLAARMLQESTEEIFLITLQNGPHTTTSIKCAITAPSTQVAQAAANFYINRVVMFRTSALRTHPAVILTSTITGPDLVLTFAAVPAVPTDGTVAIVI